jgi:hypothetical protein
LKERKGQNQSPVKSHMNLQSRIYHNPILAIEHVTLHLCAPHGSFLSQTLPQVGIGSRQLALFSCSLVLPQWHAVTFPGTSSHSPHGPGWQASRQACLPHARSWPHGSPHENTPSLSEGVYSQSRRTALQGGHGPGWHCRTQRCGHLAAATSSSAPLGEAVERGLEQGLPQECGVRKRSLGGSRARLEPSPAAGAGGGWPEPSPAAGVGGGQPEPSLAAARGGGWGAGGGGADGRRRPGWGVAGWGRPCHRRRGDGGRRRWASPFFFF